MPAARSMMGCRTTPHAARSIRSSTTASIWVRPISSTTEGSRSCTIRSSGAERLPPGDPSASPAADCASSEIRQVEEERGGRFRSGALEVHQHGEGGDVAGQVPRATVPLPQIQPQNCVVARWYAPGRRRRTAPARPPTPRSPACSTAREQDVAGLFEGDGVAPPTACSCSATLSQTSSTCQRAQRPETSST